MQAQKTVPQLVLDAALELELPSTLKLEDRLADKLDSLGVTELVLLLEDSVGDIPDEVIETLGKDATFGDLAQLIEKVMAEKAGGPS